MVRTIVILSLILTGASTTKASIANQWALKYLKADTIWKVTRGYGETVAVVDTGVQPISDIAPNLFKGADYSDTSGSNIGEGQVDIDRDGHGTGEASLISGITARESGISGLAPEAKILPARAAEVSGPALLYGVGPGIEYAVHHGARVINLALTYDLSDKAIHEAVANALSHDIVVVAAVGNDGTSQQYFPAAWPGVVGVGAIDSSGKVWERSNTGADVALVAPGVHILRDDNRGRVGFSDGTSEATAYVSAAAALVRSAHPGWSAAEVVAALEETADKPAEMRGAVRDDRYGAGILDVLAAVSLVKPPVVGGVGVRGGGAGGGRGGGPRRVVWWGVAGGVGAFGCGVGVLWVVRRRGRGEVG